MKYVLTIIAVFIVFPLSAQDHKNWDSILETAQNYLVDIEYYEEIDSRESIRNGNKIKRMLNGVIVDSSGLVITSSSIYRAQLDFSGSTQFGSSNPPSDIKIKDYSGNTYSATFVGKDDDKSVAFIESESINKGLSFDSSDINVGESIFLAYQLGKSYNSQIALVQRTVNSIIPGPIKKLLVEVLPTNAKFGVAFDSEGRAIGLFKQSHQRNHFGYEYQPQMPAFTEVLLTESFVELIKNPPRFLKKETNRKKWLGVNMQPFTRKLAEYFKVDDLEGILVNTILDDSPAEKAGLESGDVLVEFNKNKVSAEDNSDLQYLRNLVRENDSEQVKIKIWRKGKFIEKKIELADVPISQHLADEISNDSLGFSAKELTKDIIIARKWDFDINGVWVSRVERAGWADLAGLQIGDLLLKVDNKDLHSIDQLDKYLNQIEKDKPSYISFFIRRRSETQFLFIKTNFN